MSLSIADLPSRRGTLRRAVNLDCDVRAALWDGALSYRVRDISPDGLWIDSQLPLDVGEGLELSFRPPHWPARADALQTRAVVTRVGLHRRRSDRYPSGMGLRFVDLSDVARDLLAAVLVGTPPPLPVRPRAPVVGEAECQLTMPDGSMAWLSAEAPLLTSSAPRSASVPCTPIVLQQARRGTRSRRYVPRQERLAKPKRPHLRLLTA